MVPSARLPKRLRKRRKTKGEASCQNPQALHADLAGGKGSRDIGRSSGNCSWNGHSTQRISSFAESPVVICSFPYNVWRNRQKMDKLEEQRLAEQMEEEKEVPTELMSDVANLFDL